ncbi:DUF4118 domain-containing protein [Zoogloea sp.]|uniref:DUF4118 domain-containing protein n=1 Tax=Zoogloea sp. TaxID=49181 RepID=UPI001416E270|nr:MAG: DUF4118 domain-containing protein [Zoogloea sp.]
MPSVPAPSPPAFPVVLRRYGLAVGVCGLTAALIFPFQPALDLPNTVMLFLLAVVVVAVLAGRGAAVLASVLGVALFDFLFVPPRFSLEVSHARHLLTFVVMLVVSLVVGQLTAGLRVQATEAARRERLARALYDLARELAGAMSVPQVAEAVERFLLVREDARGRLVLPADQGPTRPFSGDDGLAVPDQVLQEVMASGNSTRLLRSGGYCCDVLPLSGSTRNRGALLVLHRADDTGLAPLLEALAALVVTALERLHFVAVAQAAQLEAVSERLRSTLLSALSHDVRTPLTALYGLADSMLTGPQPLPEEARVSAVAIRDQAFRLNGMVGNLLDMARLRSGRVELRREWQPVEEVVGASLKLLESALAGRALRLEGLGEQPLLEIDAVLMERVFCNLLENAAKYSPVESPIVLSTHDAGDLVEFRVTNGGVGFPPDRLEQVFALFERGQPEEAVAGMGLGLAICRTIVEAHGGQIRAFNPPQGGGCVAFTLPKGNPPPFEIEAAGEVQIDA